MFKPRPGFCSTPLLTSRERRVSAANMAMVDCSFCCFHSLAAFFARLFKITSKVGPKGPMEARYASTVHPMVGFVAVKSLQLTLKSQLKHDNAERPKNASDQPGELELTERH